MAHLARIAGIRRPAALVQTYRSAFESAARCSVARRYFATSPASVDVGIAPGLSKAEQIAAKNRNIDQGGIWSELPSAVQKSLQDPGKIRFLGWLGHGVTRGKAAIIELVTHDEAQAIIRCMGTSASRAGVMTADRTAELYVGRVNTARHLISDQTLADCFFA
ncbi:unnamed protein product, partial [Polarella glacialis]